MALGPVSRFLCSNHVLEDIEILKLCSIVLSPQTRLCQVQKNFQLSVDIDSLLPTVIHCKTRFLTERGSTLEIRTIGSVVLPWDPPLVLEMR